MKNWIWLQTWRAFWIEVIWSISCISESIACERSSPPSSFSAFISRDFRKSMFLKKTVRYGSFYSPKVLIFHGIGHEYKHESILTIKYWPYYMLHIIWILRFSSLWVILIYVGEIYLTNWTFFSPTELFSRQLIFGLANCTFFSPTELWSHQLHFFLANWTLFSPTALFSRQVVLLSPSDFSSPTFSPTWVYPI